MKRLWLIRLGKNGEYEAAALSDNVLTVDVGIKEDISRFKDLKSLVVKMAEVFPQDKPNRQRNLAAQANQFLNVAQVGDLVVTPFKTTSTIAVGEVAGQGTALPNGQARRPVRWLKTDIPRDAFRQDLLYSFGAFMTVCEISRNEALQRVQSVLATGLDPGSATGVTANGIRTTRTEPETKEASDQQINLAEIARDQIERRIASVFVGHDFTRLVDAILSAQGYRTHRSPPGPDAGVDIVAGSGLLGLDSPRVVVQVKSGDFVVDQPVLQALIGSIQDTRADHGLIVSWGGFKNAVRRRTNELFFRVRLWGREELLKNLLSVYEQLPEDIRADLPLKRTWMLVPDEDGQDEP